MEALVIRRMMKKTRILNVSLARVMRIRAIVAWVCLLVADVAMGAEQLPVTHVFLIQNSGWMEPFYTDPGSGFKKLITDGIDKLCAQKRPLIIACFNQSIGGKRSPVLLYQGSNQDEAHRAVRDIQVAKKPNSQAFTDTDLMEAVGGTITEYSPGKPAVIWVFTNNKNSPQNSPETAAKNKEFYRWVQSEKNIVRVASYSFSMPVQGKFFQAKGIMVYALAYGVPAENELQALIGKKIPFADIPARLKPLNADAVTFVPKGVSRHGNVTASQGPDRNTLILDFDSSSRPASALLSGVFRNDFFPYDISSADVALKVSFDGDAHGIRTAISPENISNVPAGGESVPFNVQIQIPPLPDIWTHPEIIFQNGYSARGEMEFTLANQLLSLSPDFQKRIEELFPGDPLPEIFIPGEAAKQSNTLRPILIRVRYPLWPLILLAGLALGVIVGGLWLISVMTRAKRYTVIVNGSQKMYALRAFRRCSLYSDQGERIGDLHRGFGKPVSRLDQGRTDQVIII